MAKKSSTHWNESDLESRGYIKQLDGSWAPPAMKSKFIQSLKGKQSTADNEDMSLTPPPIQVKTKWSKEDVVLLKLFYEQERDIPFIAMRLDKDRRAVIKKANQLGISNNPNYSEVEKETILHYYNVVSKIKPDGFLNELSILLNRQKENISRYASRLGLTDYNRKDTYVEHCKICNKEIVGIGCRDIKSNTCSKACKKELQSKNTREYVQKNGHPKGMFGKKHTDEKKANQSVIAKKYWDNATEKEISDRNLKILKTKEANGTLITPRLKTTWKQGWRDIGGYKKYYRSRWEANYARYLEFLKQNKEIKNWYHEHKTFWFEDILRGCRSYLPDFLVIFNDNSEEYHEVKGWMDDRSKTKLSRMAKYHPNVKIVVIQADWFKTNNVKLKGIIKEWEQ